MNLAFNIHHTVAYIPVPVPDPGFPENSNPGPYTNPKNVAGLRIRSAPYQVPYPSLVSISDKVTGSHFQFPSISDFTNKYES